MRAILEGEHRTDRDALGEDPVERRWVAPSNDVTEDAVTHADAGGVLGHVGREALDEGLGRDLDALGLDDQDASASAAIPLRIAR